MASGTQYQIELLLGARKASSFSSNMSSAAKSLDSIQSTAKRVAVGVTAAFAGINISDVISDATATYTDFEQSITYSSAIARATNTQFKQMKQASRNAGKYTTKTATESSESLGYMALAGWSVNESISGLMPVLKMSEATQLDLAETSDLVTDSMSALKLSVKDLPQYLDTVVEGNNDANMTAQQMMQTMIRAGGAARTLGIGYQDLGTAAGVLANNGTKGQKGGTALNAMLTRMGSNKSALKQMKKLKISIYDAKGEFVGLEKALQNINQGISGLSTKKRAAALKEIAGTQYNSQMNYLLDSVKTGAKGAESAWDDLNSQLYDSSGALDTMNQKVTGTTQGSIARMKSALDDAKISFGDAFNEEYITILDTFAEGFNNLSDGIQDFAEENEIEIHRFFEGVMDGGAEVVDFAGDAAGFVVDNIDLISSGIKGIGTAVVASKAVSGIMSITTALSSLTPAGLAVKAAFVGVAGIVGVSAAIKKAGERAVEANLDEHFGNVSLSLKQIDDIAQKIVGKKQLTKISTMLESIGKTDEAVEAAANSLKEMDSIEWKVGAGIKLTKDDIQTYKADVKDYMKQAQNILDSQGYSVSIATEILLGKDSQQGAESNAFYAGLDSQLKDLKTQLKSRLKEAVKDGVDIPTDEATQELLGKISEITEAVAEGESKARLQSLELEYSGKDLDADSFKELSKTISKYSKQDQDGLKNAYNTKMSQYNTALELGSISQSEYDQKAAEAEQAYYQKMAESYSSGYDFMMNTVKETYPELESAMEKMQTDMDAEIQRMMDEGVSGQTLYSQMDKAIENVIKKLDVDDDTKGAIETLYKDGGISKMTDQMIDLRNQMVNNDMTVPESLLTDIEGFHAIEGIGGGVDKMYGYYQDRLTNSPEYTAMALAALEAGGNLPESVDEGIRAKTPEAVEAAKYMMDQVRSHTSGTWVVESEFRISTNQAEQAVGGQKALSGLKGHSTTVHDKNGDHTIYQNALGGIYDSEILTTVAEKGAEAIIPLDGSERGKSLWYQAGKMLGMFGHVPGSGSGQAINTTLSSPVFPSMERDRILYESLVFGSDQNAASGSTSQDPSGTQPVTITYSPNITIQGNADKTVVTQALDLSQQKFNQMMEQYLKGKKRTSFA